MSEADHITRMIQKLPSIFTGTESIRTMAAPISLRGSNWWLTIKMAVEPRACSSAISRASRYCQ